MAITYFGSNSNPIDGNLLQEWYVDVPPPDSMIEGDLAIVCVTYHRSETSGLTWSCTITGGQTWNALTPWSYEDGTGMYMQLFWCQFNGTWDVDPQFTITDSVTKRNISGVMHVFRPTSGSNIFSVDVAQVTADFAAPGSPYDVTITGINTLTNGAVVLATWFTGAYKTWTLQTGGWLVAGTDQYRNGGTGSTTSLGFAYQVFPAAGATGDVVNQTQSGSSKGGSSIISFKEEPVSPIEFEASMAGDSGIVGYFAASSYPPGPGNGIEEVQIDVGQAGSGIVKLGSTNYSLDNDLIRFDTSLIPDDAVIESAVLKIYVYDKDNSDSRNYQGEWYDPSNWPIDISDYTSTPASTAWSISINDLTIGGYNEIPLSNPESNINKSGYTAFRGHISGGAPPGSTGYDYVSYLAYVSAHNPILEVTYSVLADVPEITRSPISLSPSCYVSEDVASGSFDISNTGDVGSTLSYAISDDVDWLTCVPNSGSIDEGDPADSIVVNYSTAGLAAGSYNATITISDTEASNDPQTIAVSLTINSPDNSFLMRNGKWFNTNGVNQGFYLGNK